MQSHPRRESRRSWLGATAILGTITLALAVGIPRPVLAKTSFESPYTLAQTYNVVYRGITPDTFTDGVDVVVEGRLGHDGTFRATTLLAKCASRYENAPEKYKNTPAYKKAEQRA